MTSGNEDYSEDAAKLNAQLGCPAPRVTLWAQPNELPSARDLWCDAECVGLVSWQKILFDCEAVRHRPMVPKARDRVFVQPIGSWRDVPKMQPAPFIMVDASRSERLH